MLEGKNAVVVGASRGLGHAVDAGAAPVLHPIHHHTWETFSLPWNVDVRASRSTGCAEAFAGLAAGRPGNGVAYALTGDGLSELR